MFLVDGSDSISDNEFQDQKTFIRRFVETTDIGADKIRVGYVVVSSKIGATLDLSGGKKANILAKVDNISQPQEGSRTDVGLMYVDNMFFTQGILYTLALEPFLPIKQLSVSLHQKKWQLGCHLFWRKLTLIF